MKQGKKNIIWYVLFPLLAALTVYTVVSTSQSFSGSGFLGYLASVQPGWLACAVGCMLAYVVLEGLSLRFICLRLQCRTGMGQGVIWSAADIFFSAITPSATGGQPASAVCMLRAGVPVTVCTVALLLNLCLYTLSILVISPLALLLCPQAAACFGTASRWLIGLGAGFQLVLAGLFLLLMLRARLVYRLADSLLGFLSRLRLLRHPEKWRARLESKMPDYRACAQAVGKDKKLLLGAFACNLFQRLALLGVPVCLFLGTGGNPRQTAAVAAVQACVILGSTAAPVPGAMGVADYLFLDGYAHLVEDTVSMELLSRGISFYGCFLVCGLVVFTGALLTGIEKRREKT